MSRKTFYEQELECQRIFDKLGPFYHLFTPGEQTGDIFLDRPVKEFGLNLLGICSLQIEDFRIIAYSEMTDHLHVLFAGKKESGNLFFDRYSRRLKRIVGPSYCFEGFKPTILPLPDLKSARNEIVYINRNGYVVNTDYTPFSYPWGSGLLYFNPIYDKIPRRLYSSLTRDEKRQICRSRDIDLPPGYSVMGNLIAPDEYCHAKEIGMKLFRDTHQYFNLLSKDYEAYSESAKQLTRILKLDKRIVNELFPSIIKK